jgi:RimJ/RimL family protein N-acetyltransferase
MSPNSWDRVADWWAGLFGVPEDRLWPAGVTVAPHVRLGDEDGLVVTRRGDGIRVSLPGWLDPALADQLTAHRDSLLDRKFWSTWAPTVERKVRRPIVHGYTDTHVSPPLGVERIDPAEIDEWKELVTPRKWRASGFDGPVVDAFGVRVGVSIAAAANLTSFLGSPLTVGVLTHPAHRGRGHATRVARAAVAEAVLRQGLAGYRSEADHDRSRAVGRTLRFEDFCEQLTVL